MKKHPIGVILDSFRCEHFEAMDRAVEIGAKGFQVYASFGKLDPELITPDYKKEFINNFKSKGLSVSALCGDLGKGFTNREENPALIEKSKRIIYLAKEFETNVVTTHIGCVPEDKNSDTYKVMQETCKQLADYADSLDAHFAVETGPETAEILGDFLDSLDSTGVAVNLDPANLIMCVQDDPIKAVYRLKRYIVHTHAKDGISLKGKTPNDFTDQVVVDAINRNEQFIEMPLGQGHVDWKNYLNALDEIGYEGFLTIEREVGENPTADINTAADYLRSYMR